MFFRSVKTHNEKLYKAYIISFINCFKILAYHGLKPRATKEVLVMSKKDGFTVQTALVLKLKQHFKLNVGSLKLLFLLFIRLPNHGPIHVSNVKIQDKDFLKQFFTT